MQAAEGAKARFALAHQKCAGRGFGCRLEALVICTMTALTDSDSDSDSVVPEQLAAPEVELAPEPADESQASPDAWRSEVAARLARYRSRRKPRSPRYPSLLLPFDSPDARPRLTPQFPGLSSPGESPAFAESAGVADSLDEERFSERKALSESPPSRTEQVVRSTEFPPEPSAKVIEFPRSAAIPVTNSSTLADPVFDRPRIVEAAEVVPPPPALGGILIDPDPSAALPPVRPEAELPLPCASISRRLLATIVDGLILVATLAAFTAIFLRLNPLREPLPPLALIAGTAATLFVAFWMVYQFVFVVLTGSTPGLHAARLKVARLDGSPVTRSLRRWRVLASFLSFAAAGLGYLWCLLDSDSLCWHDRITRTSLQPLRSAD